MKQMQRGDRIADAEAIEDYFSSRRPSQIRIAVQNWFYGEEVVEQDDLHPGEGRFTLRCQECGWRWGSNYQSSFCPECGACHHYWELSRGECEWCFGGLEHCPNCLEERQHHGRFCPEADEEDRPEDYILIGTIDLHNFHMDSRHWPFEVASEHKGILLDQADRSGWKYSVWVRKDVTEAAFEAARLTINFSDGAVIAGKKVKIPT